MKKGLKKFLETGVQAAKKELGQLHQQVCFAPVDVSKLTPSELKKAVEALMLLSQKKSKVVKGRCVYNRKPMKVWLSREETTVGISKIISTPGK